MMLNWCDSTRRAVCTIGCLLAVSGAAPILLAQYASLAEHPSIAYSKAAPTDRVAQLIASIERGDTVVPYDPDRGYLPGLLTALKVPVSSQGLVFSRTSLQ